MKTISFIKKSRPRDKNGFLSSCIKKRHNLFSWISARFCGKTVHVMTYPMILTPPQKALPNCPAEAPIETLD